MLAAALWFAALAPAHAGMFDDDVARKGVADQAKRRLATLK